MSVLDKLLDAVKLNDDYDEDDYLDDDLLDSDDDDFLDDDQEDKPVKKIFSRNSLKKLMTKRLMILMMKNRLQLHRNSQSKLFPYQKYLSNRTSRYEVLHPRSLQCEAAERDHRQQIWKYV